MAVVGCAVDRLVEKELGEDLDLIAFFSFSVIGSLVQKLRAML
jgi:hypothetical protein